MKYKLINSVNENYSPYQQILVNRGIEPKDIEHYLKTQDSDILEETLLDNIEKGTALLIKHILKGSKILVQVDSDCDGYTSAATLINYLYKQFPAFVKTNLFIRVHDGKEHGVVLDSILGKGYDMVIIPDAGSNQYEEHRVLKENGIDVLVLDHHEAEKVSDDAIVINNQLCGYPNKTLSGVGVVYKFISFLDKKLEKNDAEGFLDLVALGMIADMMDMRTFETKHLIQKGLSNIQNPFFKGLVERQSFSLGGTITPIGIAFYIAPLINATIRVGTQSEKEVMFKAMLNHYAYEQIPSTKRGHKGEFEAISTQAIRNSINIRNRQKKSRDEGMIYVEKIIKENRLDLNKIIVVEVNDDLDKNLTGLVANQLMAKYQKPVILVRETEGSLQGSARGYDKSELKDFKEFLTYSNLIDYAEGHPNAMGVGFQKDKMQELISYANTELSSIDFSSSYDVDYIYQFNDFKAQDIVDIGGMKSLWGKGVDEALVVIEGIKVTKNNLTLMSADKNPTLKIVLQNGTSLIKFGSSKEEYESLLTDGFIEVNVLGTCAINEWQGNVTPQLLIKEYEIVGKQEYYF